MNDMEKVISELTECIDYIRLREFDKIPLWGNCQIAMMDAVSILKEHEAQIERLEYDLAVTQNNLNYYVNGND